MHTKTQACFCSGVFLWFYMGGVFRSPVRKGLVSEWCIGKCHRLLRDGAVWEVLMSWEYALKGDCGIPVSQTFSGLRCDYSDTHLPCYLAPSVEVQTNWST